MTYATVWGRGDDPESVRGNCEKYISRRWRTTTKECCVAITGRKNIEGTSFAISVYTSDRNKVGQFGGHLRETALMANGKPDFIIIELYDYMASDQKKHRSDLKDVEQEYKRREQYLIHKFKDDPRVKALTRGQKPIEVYPTTTLLSELASEQANKVIVETIDEYFPNAVNVMHLIAQELIKHALAKDLRGYELGKDAERLDVISAEEIETGEAVRVFLGYPT